MFAIMNRLRCRDDGVTAIEYALIASLIAVAIIASTRALGTDVAAVFAQVSTAFTAA